MAIAGEQRTKVTAMSRSVVRKFGRHVVAHEVEHGDQIPGFCILEVGYGIYGVGFVTLFMKTHRSEGRLRLLMVLYLQRLSLLMVARQWQRLGGFMGHSGGLVLLVTL